MNAPLKTPRRRGAQSGNRNQGSKWISRKRRAQIYTRDKHRCLWCQKYPERLSLDHVVARALGGTNHTHNLVTSCLPCNTDRGDRSLFQYARDKFREPEKVIWRVLAALDAPLEEAA